MRHIQNCLLCCCRESERERESQSAWKRFNENCSEHVEVAELLLHLANLPVYASVSTMLTSLLCIAKRFIFSNLSAADHTRIIARPTQHRRSLMIKWIFVLFKFALLNVYSKLPTLLCHRTQKTAATQPTTSRQSTFLFPFLSLCFARASSFPSIWAVSCDIQHISHAQH